ncbi:M81 family metallopeptidase [Treponema sp. OMZ 840]|uniref:M81 family metallopeptidase n=1 Tax=Treponema sp. OMZ 840 TaxID=244313 RepID=UPI003D8DB630
MKKRVLVGGMHHESDTFNPITTGENDIWVIRGKELIESKGQSSVCGAIATLKEAGYEVLPALIARAVPNGEWDKDYYLKLKAEFLQAVKDALPLDALCLSLHGSMRVRGIGEAEGDLLEDIRKICPDIPILSSLDMHATISDRMLRYVDGYVGYKCAPHTDTYETGVHAARMTIDTLEKGAKPVLEAVKIPFLIAGEQSETSVEPMKKLIAVLREVEKERGIMAASYLLGFPWADTADNGVTAMVVADGDRELARKKAKELAQLFWDTRSEFGFYNETREIADALKHTKLSIEEGVYPVVLSDSGDNPTAGSSQDVTNFLKEIMADSYLSSLNPPLCYQAFYDPALVEAAFKAGEGSIVEGTLGAAFDTVKSSPIAVKARVKKLCKAWPGAQNSDMALIDVQGIDVIVTSKHVGCYDPEMMRALGVEPEQCKAIVVKLGYLEPEIRAIAKRSMLVLTDGSTNEVFSRLEYKELPRPIYPLDKDMHWKA